MKRITRQNQQAASEKQIEYLNGLLAGINNFGTGYREYPQTADGRRLFEIIGPVEVAADVANWEASQIINLAKDARGDYETFINNVIRALVTGYFVKDGKRLVRETASACRALNIHDELYNKVKDELPKV